MITHETAGYRGIKENLSSPDISIVKGEWVKLSDICTMLRNKTGESVNYSEVKIAMHDLEYKMKKIGSATYYCIIKEELT